MSLFDSIPREVYDREKDRADKAEARVDYLTKQLVALKKKGFELPHEAKPSRIIPAGPTPEESATKRMHDQLIENLAQDIEAMPGIPKDVAFAEAKRIRETALGGSVGEPFV